jgi:hypothetical protein
MGFSLSVGILQAVIEAVSEASVEGTTASFIAYVDNVRFLVKSTDDTSSLTLRTVTDRFADLAARFNITLGPTLPNTPFLGIEYAYDTGKCFLSTDSISKCSESLRDLFVSPCLLTLQRALGHLIWAATVLDIPLCKYFYVLKFFSRRCTVYEHQPSASFTIWPSIVKDFLSWMTYVEQNEPVDLCRIFDPRTVSWTLVTDASSTGYGCVWLSSVGDVFWSSHEWNPSDLSLHINCKELRSVYHALLHPPASFSLASHLSLYADNTTLCGALKRMYSPSFAISRELNMISPLLPRSVWISWLHSRDNIADPPSRGSAPSLSAISAFTLHVADSLGVGTSED